MKLKLTTLPRIFIHTRRVDLIQLHSQSSANWRVLRSFLSKRKNLSTLETQQFCLPKHATGKKVHLSFFAAPHPETDLFLVYPESAAFFGMIKPRTYVAVDKNIRIEKHEW